MRTVAVIPDLKDEDVPGSKLTPRGKSREDRSAQGKAVGGSEARDVRYNRRGV